MNNDRTVYDSEGGLVCRPLMALGIEDEATPERPTLRGIPASSSTLPSSEDAAVDILLQRI